MQDNSIREVEKVIVLPPPTDFFHAIETGAPFTKELERSSVGFVSTLLTSVASYFGTTVILRSFYY